MVRRNAAGQANPNPPAPASDPWELVEIFAETDAEYRRVADAVRAVLNEPTGRELGRQVVRGQRTLIVRVREVGSQAPQLGRSGECPDGTNCASI